MIRAGLSVCLCVLKRARVCVCMCVCMCYPSLNQLCFFQDKAMERVLVEKDKVSVVFS